MANPPYYEDKYSSNIYFIKDLNNVLDIFWMYSLTNVYFNKMNVTDVKRFLECQFNRINTTRNICFEYTALPPSINPFSISLFPIKIGQSKSLKNRL